MKAIVLAIFSVLILFSCSNPDTEFLDMKNDCIGIYRVEWLWTSDTPKRIVGIQKQCENQDVILEALLNWEGDSIDMTHRWENGLLTHEFIIKHDKVLLADVYIYDSLGNQLNYYSFMPSENISSQKIYTNYYDESSNHIKQTKENLLGEIESEIIKTYDDSRLIIESQGQFSYHYSYNEKGDIISKKQTSNKTTREMNWVYQYENNNIISKTRYDKWKPEDSARIGEWEAFEYDKEDNLIQHLMGFGNDTDLFYQYEYFAYENLPDDIKELFKL